MRLLELYKDSAKKLEQQGILTSKLDVKILLSFLLDIDTKELIMYFNQHIDQKFINNFNQLFTRRLNREPIANIVNKKSFWSYDFFVNENVLTPRSDSEILVEAVLSNYNNMNENLNILDLGTGSGCLILSLLKIYKNASGLAVDISDKALQVAKQNAKNLKVENIKFLKNNWSDNIEEKFDIIISNPPYIPTNDIKDLTPEVNKFNPILALDGGKDGLNCYRYLAESLDKNLKKDTKIFLEIGKNQEKDIEKIFNENGYKLLKIYKDLAEINRILCFKKN